MLKLLVILLRHAHKYIISKGSIGLFCLWSLLSFSACSHDDKQLVDKLNSLSYANHYRNLDSTEIYAQKAFVLADGYGDGKAEALNNLAFVDIMRMNYRDARKALATVEKHTDNQVELLIADVLSMRICQRMSENRSFYDFRQCAIDRIKRIDEEQENLNSHNKQRLLYAKSEFAIVSSAYYYYVGFDSLSANALSCIDGDGEIRRDTAQYLNYLYNIGPGGVSVGATAEETCLREFECHATCYLLAKEYGYTFFMANSMEAMAEILLQPNVHDLLLTHTSMAVSNIWYGIDGISLLPKELARQSLFLFEKYGDAYQVAGAYRTLASCLIAECDYQGAFDCLQKALSDEKIQQAPDLVASIREQLSIVYSGLNDKHGSDYNRNIYLDLQEQTRQDRYMESRAEGLENTILQLNCMIAITIVAIVILLVLLFCFDYYSRKRNRNLHSGDLLRPLEEWQKRFNKQMDELRNERETLAIRMDVCIARRQEYKLRNLENRAKLSLVNSIIPFIDRMINELDRLVSRKDNAEERERRYTYVSELVDKINEYNDVLAQWIQLRKGQLGLHIESFALEPLFAILRKSRTAFMMNGIELCVEDTELSVKADRALTLFMINTLADNARKFTTAGGKVVIGATEMDNMVEISVKDTGCGIPKERLACIWNFKMHGGHGFGLMNCKSIIEKYKRMSRTFQDCSISARSEEGKGSCFSFRLPKGKVLSGIVSCMLLLCTYNYTHARCNASTNPNMQSYLSIASAYADSAYFSNIAGTYDKTTIFADSCLRQLNLHYFDVCPAGRDTLSVNGSSLLTPVELTWCRGKVPTNYSIILDIRNESAVAALALHDWNLYEFNNKSYTQLFKELSADSTLADYCRVMQQSQTNKTISIIILLVVLISILPAYYLLYYRHQLYNRYCIERIKSMMDLLHKDITNEEKLEQIKLLSDDVYPQKFKYSINKIEQALFNAISLDDKQRTDIKLAEDELRRIEYEANNLYAYNAVLDNCLSALKHETMYYPSRISMLLSGRENNLGMIHDLVVYYREIYSTLSMQAMRLLTKTKLHLSAIPVNEVVSVEGLAESQNDCMIIGDKDLLRYMFKILCRQPGYCNTQIGKTSETNGYVSIWVYLKGYKKEQIQNVFVPRFDNIPFLLCKQVVSDISEATRHWRSGMFARYIDECFILEIILPRYVKRMLKH